MLGNFGGGITEPILFWNFVGNLLFVMVPSPQGQCWKRKKALYSSLLWGRGNLGVILRDSVGEGNCESKIAARKRGVHACRDTFRSLAGPSGYFLLFLFVKAFLGIHSGLLLFSILSHPKPRANTFSWFFSLKELFHRTALTLVYVAYLSETFRYFCWL